MKEMICICCPRGCHLSIDDDLKVTGNLCPKGEAYARAEVTNPVRIVTSTVRVKNRIDTVVSVKTVPAAPKGRMFEIIDEINKVGVNAPIKIGDVVIKNVLGLSVDIVATKNIE